MFTELTGADRACGNLVPRARTFQVSGDRTFGADQKERGLWERDWTRWRQTNHDARTFKNEAKKGAESRIAGSYTQEARVSVQFTHPYNIVTLDIACDAFLNLFYFLFLQNRRSHPAELRKGGSNHFSS